MKFPYSPMDCRGGKVPQNFICCQWGKTRVFPHTHSALFFRDTLIKAKRIKSGSAQKILLQQYLRLHVAQNPPREYMRLNGANLI